jgi:hypothetical protein
VKVDEEPRCDTNGLGEVAEDTPTAGDHVYEYGERPPLAAGEPPIITLSALHATSDLSGPASAVGF